MISIYSQNKALEAQDRILTDIVRVSKNQQNTLFSALTSEAQNAVKIINGRMVPVMEKYIRLNGEQQEAVDTATEEYNGLSESITENTQKQKENTKAIEESLQKIEDKTVEFYDTLKDAVTNAEKKKLDALIAGLEEERKLLEKRKSMYEKAFAETDYTNTLEELEQNRQEIIKDIAALEGATDLASAKKREELLTKKAELDKEYNSNVTDYNREALYQTIEDAETAIDLEQEQYEAAYEERINSVRWMEEEIQTIQNEGLDATIAYLKEHLPEYEEAWTVSKDNIEREWVLLYDTVNTTVDEIQNNLPDFSDMLSQLREAANLVKSKISGLVVLRPQLVEVVGNIKTKYRITSLVILQGLLLKLRRNQR